MKFKWRKWTRIIHRDLGYFFVALTIIYGLSGIALNHINDWNPNYIIKTKTKKVNIPATKSEINHGTIVNVLKLFDKDDNYKNHYFPNKNTLKIFIDYGSIVVNLYDKTATLETMRRRPVFHMVNFLHYNPGKWWTWIADIFSGSLILFAITGLFMVKGKNGIKWRGTIFGILGLLVPLLFLLLFY